MSRFTLLGILFLGVYLGLPGQVIDWEFNVVEMPGGSLGNRVGVIAQDSIGYMWFGSARGLHRYDGRQFKTFLSDPLDSTTLTDNYVDELFVDSRGTLWVGTARGGLMYYLPESEQFHSFPLLAKDSTSGFNDWIPAIAEDNAGQLWVGTWNGLFRIDRDRAEAKHFSHDPANPRTLSYNMISDLVVDHSGTLWVCCGWYPSGRFNGGLNRYIPETEDFDRFLHEPGNPNSLEENVVWTAFEDKQNTFWVGTSGDGLHTLDRTTGRFTHFHYDPQNPQKVSSPSSVSPLMGSSENAGVRRILQDQLGFLWIVSFDNGLVIYQPETKQIFRYENASDLKNGQPKTVPSKSFWKHTVNKDGSVWLAGGQPGRVLRARPIYQAFQFIDLKETVTFHDLSALGMDRNGGIWVGTRGLGLLHFDLQTDRTTRYSNSPGDPTSISGNTIWSFYEDRRGLLLDRYVQCWPK